LTVRNFLTQQLSELQNRVAIFILINYFINQNFLTMEARKLSLKEMEIVEGGCSATANKAIATIGAIAGVGSCFGIIGLALFGPTAIGCSIASMVCAYQE